MTQLACMAVPLVGSAAVAGLIAGLAELISALYQSLPFAVGPLAVAIVAAIAAASATIALLAPLVTPNATLGDYIANATNALTQAGMLGIAQTEVNSILTSGQGSHQIVGLSFEIMDTYNYQADCFRALSLEVAFDADKGDYLEFVSAVLQIINSFAQQNILYGGYISLRFCGASGALLAMEQYEHTVCIELSSLAGVASDGQVFAAFANAARQRNAIFHWGQLNDCDRAYIETVFGTGDPSPIARWRAALARLAAGGGQDTFDNDFCQGHGLEAYGAQARALSRDLSYLKPLLLA